MASPLDSYKDAVWDFLLAHSDITHGGALFIKFYTSHRADFAQRIPARLKGYHREDPKTKEQVKETRQQAFKATKTAKRERYILSRPARQTALQQMARKNRRRRIIPRVRTFLRVYGLLHRVSSPRGAGIMGENEGAWHSLSPADVDAQRPYGKERCMRRMGYTCLLLMALVLPQAVCLADDASHRQAAETLLTVIKTEQDIQENAERLTESLLRQNPQLAAHNTVVKTFITKHMNWAILKDDMINLYVQAFTEDELKQLTTFYRSPIGQKAADKMPQLADAGTQLGITRLRANREELDQMIGTEQQKPEKHQ